MWSGADVWPQGLSVYPPLVLTVVLLARLLPLNPTYHPLTAYRYLALQLGAKVNPDPNRPRQQLVISGALAIFVATLPFVALLYSVYQFSDLPYLLDALLLYCSLSWQSTCQQAKQVQRQLSTGQLSLARQLAKPLLLRRTANLSAMGLSKALIESLTLRSATELVAVLCWFLLGGGIAAFSYRLLLELQQQWNSKLPRYRHFGQPCAAIVTLCSALPVLLCCLILGLQHGIRRCYQQARQHRYNISLLSFWLLACSSAAIKRSLGGPLYYNHIKRQRSRLAQPYEPSPTDITGIIKVLQFMQGYLYLLLAMVSVMQLVWHIAD